MRLKVKLDDVFRATLSEDCGNLGYLGLAPDGGEYHVVVPVDLQLARGVKAGNRPDDGTPFGGYRGWHYFECRNHRAVGPETSSQERRRQTRANAEVLVSWAASLGLELEIVE